MLSPGVGSLPLSYGARRVAERALEHQRGRGQDKLGVNHWLLALLERHGAMAEALAVGLDATLVRRQLRRQLDEGEVGDVLEARDAANRAVEVAGNGEARERHLASTILAAAGYHVREEPDYAPDLAPQVSLRAPAGGPTPVLDEFGVDLTQKARQGELPPIVGREDEIRRTCTTLCRRSKRNPALIGPAGTGKTAIVEGLAQRVADGQVPDALKDIRIVEIQPASLVAGARIAGQLEERVKTLLQEAQDNRIVLFIDELHSIVGSGGLMGTADIGAQLKPALARGVSCIGATTDDEYRRFIARDRAMERRFNTIAVGEMSPEDTLMVLAAHRDHLSELREVQVPDDVLQWLVAFGEDFLRNRVFPDKAVDLLEQCVATAVMQGVSRIDVEVAQAVAEDMVGVPVDLGERLASLEGRLTEAALLGPEEIDALLDRIAVTIRGLDLQPARPNAVVLLADRGAEVTGELAETIADTLLGDVGRIVELDFGQYDKVEDINTLLGAPPAYIGFGEHLPLHDLAQMPFSVVVCKNVDGCHPQVREVLTQGLSDGFITERSGKRVYLSDAIVIMTAPSEGARKLAPGFRSEMGTSSLDRVLGSRLLEQVDVTVTEGGAPTTERGGWIETTLLPGLAEQYQEEGLRLRWDHTVIDWAREQQRSHPSRALLTRVIERHAGEALVPHLPPPGNRRDLLVTAADGQLHIAETTEE